MPTDYTQNTVLLDSKYLMLSANPIFIQESDKCQDKPNRFAWIDGDNEQSGTPEQFTFVIWNHTQVDFIKSRSIYYFEVVWGCVLCLPVITCSAESSDLLCILHYLFVKGHKCAVRLYNTNLFKLTFKWLMISLIVKNVHDI